MYKYAKIDDEFSVDFKYIVSESIRLNVESGNGPSGPPFNFIAAFTFNGNTISGALTLRSDSHNFHRSSEITIQYGKQGRVEITVGGLQKHSMRLEMHDDNRRIARAIFNSPTFGKYEFAMDKDVKSGIVVLTTGHGIHKLSFKLEDEGRKSILSINLESPLMSNGHATFQTTVDWDDNVYSGRIAFNNEHFLSWRLTFKEDQFYVSTSLESIYLEMPFNGVLELTNGKHEASILMSIKYKGDHKLTASLNKNHFGTKLDVASPYIWYGEWQFESEFENAGNGMYVIKASGNVGDEKAEILGNFTLRSCHDFAGSFAYQGTSLAFSKAKIDFQVLLSSEESVLDFHLATTHPSLPHLRFLMSLKDSRIGNSAETIPRYIGKVVLDTSRDITFEATMDLPHQQNLEENYAKMSFSTIYGQFNFDSEWNFNEQKVKSVNLNLHTPMVEKLAISLKIMPDELVMELESNHELVSKMVLHLTKSSDFSIRNGELSATFLYENSKYYINLAHAFEDQRRFLTVRIDTPFTEYDHYEFHVGFEDTLRKSVKAHVTYPSGEFGALFDYYFQSSFDFKLEAEIDLPIPELKVTGFKLGHQLTQDSYSLLVGGEWYGWNLDLESRFKFDHVSTMLDVQAKFNDYDGNIYGFIDKSTTKAKTTVKLQFPCGTFELMLDGNYQEKDVTASVTLKDIQHFFFQRNFDTKTTTLELRDIYFQSAIKGSLTSDEASELISNQVTLEMIWDTANESGTTELVTFGLQQTPSSYSYNGQVTWPNRETDKIIGNIERTPGKLLASHSILHNDERRFGLDTTVTSEYDYATNVSDVEFL